MATLVVVTGCARDPLDEVCPAVAPGDVVVSELRGPQSGSGGDTYGQWFELFNATGAAIDLGGLHVIMTRIDGGSQADIIIRRGNMVAAGDYAVLGRFDQGSEPAHVDFGYLPAGCADSGPSGCTAALPYGDSIYNSGAAELVACGTVIDKVIFRDMPSTGTWAFDGAQSPNGTTNDDESMWCADTNDGVPDPTELGIRGTPGESNPPCPT